MNIMVSIVHLSNLSLIKISMLNGFLACNEIIVYQLTVLAMLLNPLEESVDSPGLHTYKLTYRLWPTIITREYPYFIPSNLPQCTKSQPYSSYFQSLLKLYHHVDQKHVNSTCCLEVAATIHVGIMNADKTPKLPEHNLWEQCYRENSNVEKKARQIFHASRVHP